MSVSVGIYSHCSARADAGSGWADLGNPERVIDTLNQNQIAAEWLRERHESHVMSAMQMRASKCIEINHD